MPETRAAPQTAAQPRFEPEAVRIEDDRVVITGRWFEVRGLRFLRPALLVGGRRVLATLDHKPWAPGGDGLWTAAFPWDQSGDDLDGALLAVAPRVIVPLQPDRQPEPGDERDALKQAAARERRAAHEAVRERDEAQLARIAAERERDHARAQRDEAIRDRQAAVRAHHRMQAHRDEAVEARHHAESERDDALAACDRAERASRQATPERDRAFREREAAASASDRLKVERDDAVQARRAAEGQRDVALRAWRALEQDRTPAAEEHADSEAERRPVSEADSAAPTAVSPVATARERWRHVDPARRSALPQADLWAIRALATGLLACLIVLLVILVCAMA